jgi:phosphatidylglycerol:prolipoprotein diacylglycerol transferase
MVSDFITFVVLGTMIGGRLGYAIFYSPDLLTDFSGHFPYWGVLRLWEGGMASHGGIAGIVAACAIFAWRYGVDWRHLADLTTLGGSIGIFFGRIANFINGELFGREASPQFPLAVKFPGEMQLWFQHDVERKLSDLTSTRDLLPKMTEAVKALGNSAGVTLDQWSTYLQNLRSSTMAQAQAQRLIELVSQAIQDGNEKVRLALGAELTPRHPSQLYEACLEGLLLFVAVFWFWRKPRKPGVVGCLWLIGYALVRILGESFRLPDPQLGFRLFDLTRGQWLSLYLLVVSIGLLIWVQRREAPLIAGWGPEAQKLREESPIPYQGERRRRADRADRSQG